MRVYSTARWSILISAFTRKPPRPNRAIQPFLAEVRGAKAQAVAEGKAEAKEKDQN
jgi:hypothetical protein